MSTKIRVKSLSTKEINRAIKEIERYKRNLVEKCVQFCKELAEIGQTEASVHIGKSPLGNYVTVTTEINPTSTGCKAVLMAVGQEKSNDYGTVNTLLLIEFGAGIYHNSTPNPWADDAGYGVGTFPGQTHAFEDGWWYPKEDGTWAYTHGVKATMPMYNADIEMILNIEKVARRVFKS
jgi:hypothetical protein